MIILFFFDGHRHQHVSDTKLKVNYTGRQFLPDPPDTFVGRSVICGKFSMASVRVVCPTIRLAVRVTVTMRSTVETYRSIIPKLIFITGWRAGDVEARRSICMYIAVPSVTQPWLLYALASPEI